jgi:glycerol kinase
MMQHVLAIDEGTTGVTCLMVREDGKIAGRGYREISQFFPQPGWVEHDAEEIFARTLESAREAIATSGAVPDTIGITNQRETILIWDRATGKPLSRAIVWQDRRTTARCIELRDHEGEIAKVTGLRLDPYFSASKLEYMIREQKLAKRGADGSLAAGTMDTWLIWKLTGGTVHATDPSNASRTMLYDIEAGKWSSAMCEMFGVPMGLLPEVRPSGSDFGITRADIFGTPIPINGVAGDQQAALFGQGCWKAGEGKNTYGTGAFLLVNTGQIRPQQGAGLLTTVACDERGTPAFALESSIFIAGAAVQWLRDGLGIIKTASETEALAKSLESNDGVYFVPALVGLGAPHWEPDARGMIVGLTRGTTRAHFARAALEAMAYGTADVLSTMQDLSGVSFQRLRVDGGASANDWLMQFQADMLGVPVERPDIVETTALGAGGLAGISRGVWTSAAEFLGTRKFTTYTPGDDAATRRESMTGWRRAVRATLAHARDRE